MDVDQALYEVGGIRRYHLFLFVTLGFSCMVPTAIDSMMLVFVGWTPAHHCRQFPPNATLNETEKFQEGFDSCYLTTEDNETIKCPYGWIYNADPNKEWSIVSEWDLVCGQDYLSELAEILASTGAVIGLVIFAPLMDRFGRKWPYLLCTALFIVFTAAMGFTNSYPVYLALRFINVNLNECVIAGGALMLIELFSTEHRTFSGIGLEFVWVFSYEYLALIYFVVRQWRHFLFVSSIPWLIFLSFIWLLPESLPWLVANGHIKEAIESLSFLAKANGVDWTPPETIMLHHDKSYDELVELNAFTKNDITEKNYTKWVERDEDAKVLPVENQEEDLQSSNFFRKFIILFKNKYTRRHFIISSLLWFTNIWVYYGIIFSLPSLVAGNKYLSFAVGGLVEIPAHALCFVIVRYSRKIPTMLFHIFAGVALYLGTLFLALDLCGTYQHTLLMIFGLAGKFCVTASFAIIVLYINELFPTSMRSTGAGLSKSIGRIGTVLAPSIAYVAKKKPWVASLILGTISVVTGVATILLPETCHAQLPNTMEDIRDLYKNKNKTKKLDQNPCS